ncbi:MAG: hypothetical protein D8M58_20245 [Calditrichaeota bacterium]|nr:MAG: hypothetical protein DWQ03_14230 [Calditrichota bacterium]MBL1207742.1 hypothetical protein [Calditrichota bacterium]NOG47576.1 hypothetical protein [Calditrichota bacterium]
MILNRLKLLITIVRVNLKIIFGNKFIYFVLAGVGFYLFVALIGLFDADWYPDQEDVYYTIIFPGLLLIFYPTAFGIQNDMDSRTLEMLFGIPNYRYKVWLVRLIIILFTVFFILVFLSWLSSYLIVSVPIFEMAWHLMFPVFFVGSLCFMVSTLIKNGNGTAAVMVLIGLIFWISAGIFESSKWNIFLNPYDFPYDVYLSIWDETVFYNRLYLVIGSILTILGGLFRLQKREKFIQ